MESRKKGDMMDGILWQSRITRERNEMAVISDYPEIVTEILRKFISIWMLPEVAIPTKRESSKYKQWILELQEIERVCSGDISCVMSKAYQNYTDRKMDFMVSHPLAIKKLLIDTVAKMAREKATKKTFADVVIPSEQPMKKEDMKGMMKDLKNMFREDDKYDSSI
jgi:hypothetical protein